MSKDNKTELWDSSIEEIQKGYIEKEEYYKLGHRQANVGHFGQIGTLAAKQLPHIGVALAEQIDIFFAHVVQTSLSCRSRKSGGLQSAVKRLAHFDNDNIILGIFSENNT